MNYKFLEAFSYGGLYYEPGQVVDLTPEVAATLPEGVAEQLPTAAKPAQDPPPKSAKS